MLREAEHSASIQYYSITILGFGVWLCVEVYSGDAAWWQVLQSPASVHPLECQGPGGIPVTSPSQGWGIMRTQNVESLGRMRGLAELSHPQSLPPSIAGITQKSAPLLAAKPFPRYAPLGRQRVVSVAKTAVVVAP
jgi:hypothetical protein